MALELSGRVLMILPEQSGTGKNGQWLKQDFVIETEEQYPRKVCFSAWGDKASLVKNLKKDAAVKVSFNVESREFNGKWYTDLRMWKIEIPEQAGGSVSAGGYSDSGMEPILPGEPEDAADNDLPF